MLELKNIDLNNLAQALDFQFMDDRMFFWIQPATGAIDVWSNEDFDEEEDYPDDVAEEAMHPDDRGGIRIEPRESYEGYRDMEDFIATVQNQTIRDSLIRSISRSKPFRHFQDALHRYPEQTERWYAFHDHVMMVSAVEWLQRMDLIAPAEAEAELTRLRGEENGL